MLHMEKDLLVVKSNELIENFVFNATELELQILNYAVAITNPKWESKNAVYRISISELTKIFKTNSNRAWDLYRIALKRLMQRKYSYFLDNGTERTENLVIRVDRPSHNKWLEFKFNDYISERIKNLSVLFTQYEIKHISMFKSRYSFMLYEFFKMKLSQITDNKYSHKISIDSFKKNLDISKKYERVYDLRKIVLDRSKLNINKHSDIYINYEIIKTGRTPTDIKFTAKYKKGKSPTEILDNQKSENIINENKNIKNEISKKTKQKPLTREQLELRKEKWKSVKSKLNI